MRAIDIIRAKRDRGVLSPDAIQAFVNGAATGSWPDYQLSALLMAIWLNGMKPEEIADLTRCMANSGKRYRWDDIPGPKVDKHSTGGVGDKTSLILAPLVACCGVIVPMMSGRGLGHSGGTLDKLEAIPGFRVGLSEEELRQALKTIGVGMIGQSADVAPADRTLYALRDVTATVESLPLITASILSKKLSEGIDALVMDVKVGNGAFMKTLPDAQALAQTLVSVGNANGVKTVALITRMNEPLGEMVGNALEVKECIDILNDRGSKVLASESMALSAKMVVLGKRAVLLNAVAELREALSSGKALEKFRQMIEFQGGDPKVVDDPSRLPSAPNQMIFRAKRSGFVTELDAYEVGVAAVHLGAGRAKASDRVDPAVGLRVLAPVGTPVREGDGIFEVHYRTEETLKNALPLLEKATVIVDNAPLEEGWFVEEIS